MDWGTYRDTYYRSWGAMAMTYEEAIIDLEICYTDVRPCEECSHKDMLYCNYQLMEDSLDLIKRQQAEIEKLKESRDRWKQLAKDFDEDSRENEKELESLYAENETLNNRLSKLQWSCDFELDYRKELLKRAKAEAIKEFAERFLKKVHDNHYVLKDAINSTDYGMFTAGIEQAVNETKKEMVGANNDR